MNQQAVLSADLATQLQATGLSVNEGTSLDELNKAIEGRDWVVTIHSKEVDAPYAHVNEGGKLGSLAQQSEHLSATGRGSTDVEAVARAYLDLHRQVSERDAQRTQ